MVRLTRRQRDVAVLAARGLSNKAIARRLDIGAGTVKAHLHVVYGKTKTSNRTELSLEFFPRDDCYGSETIGR